MGAVGAALADAATDDMANAWVCGNTKSREESQVPHKSFPRVRTCKREKKANPRLLLTVVETNMRKGPSAILTPRILGRKG